MASQLDPIRPPLALNSPHWTAWFGPKGSQPEPAAQGQLPFGGGEQAPVPDCPHGEAGRVPTPRRRVISASKRTDIPAFYLSWMLKRCEAGWADVPNPMFRRAADPLKRLSHVSLRPEHVIAIVWWSKNYAVYERFHEAFARYPRQHFHFTINSRRPDLEWLEPDVPPVEEALRQVRFLATLRGGPNAISWRYDPICFWSEDGRPRQSWDPDFFEHMCRELSAIGLRSCFTSLADRYQKYEQRTKKFFPGISLRDPTEDEIAEIASAMASIARAFGIQLFACTEGPLGAQPQFRKASCIDGGLFGATPRPATDRKMKGREECGCTLHTDIGDYVTQECGYSCVYCYANPNHRRFGASSPLVPPELAYQGG